MMTRENKFIDLCGSINDAINDDAADGLTNADVILACLFVAAEQFRSTHEAASCAEECLKHYCAAFRDACDDSQPHGDC